MGPRTLGVDRSSATWGIEVGLQHLGHRHKNPVEWSDADRERQSQPAPLPTDLGDQANGCSASERVTGPELVFTVSPARPARSITPRNGWTVGLPFDCQPSCEGPALLSASTGKPLHR